MVTNWTDEGLSSPSARVEEKVTIIRSVHVSELRNALIAENNRRNGGTFPSFEDSILANYAKVRAKHIEDLRSACSTVRNIPVVAIRDYSAGCPTDITPQPSFEDPTLVPNETLIRATHINDLRSYLTTMESVTCLCNCNYFCSCHGKCDCQCQVGCNH